MARIPIIRHCRSLRRVIADTEHKIRLNDVPDMLFNHKTNRSSVGATNTSMNMVVYAQCARFTEIA